MEKKNKLVTFLNLKILLQAGVGLKSSYGGLDSVLLLWILSSLQAGKVQQKGISGLVTG